MVEDSEQYLVTLFGAGGAIADWTVQIPELTLPSEIVANLTASAGPVLTFHISQIGRHTASVASVIEVNTVT